MSSLNVRFAQKTRRKTDLLNCTNLPSSDSVRQAGVELHQESNNRANTPASVRTRCVYRDKIKRKQEGLRKDRWGEAVDYEKVTSI